MEILKVDNVSKSFIHSAGTLEVLRNIHFALSRGQIVGIVGPTGCGKSTLLRIIADLENSSSGTVTISEIVADHKRRTGMLFQSPTLLAWRKISENIRLPFELCQLDSDVDVDGTISDVIRSVGLEGFEHYYPSEISGGMQARTALARALVLRPPILLLDEPFASIDEITRFSLCGLLVKVLDKFDSSAILVTHSLDEAILLSDRIIVLSARPATIVGIVDIAMPKEERLREPEDPGLVHAKKQVRQFLAHKVLEGVG